eukprot:TRINITY_DN984_c0_g1_i1.p1 TRINITY_DN984_c0_g1~~TRINITY_DN984_c0_g1_i1.p1  ORF type:complete len:194 (-),score=72.14 TRINITY_DN984_c0_g1_i1:43-624(-)
MQIASELSSVYCAMAEVYLTDSCFAEDAEEQCEKLLARCLELNPENAEGLLQTASMRLSQQRPHDALEVLNSSVALWQDLEMSEKPPLQARLSAAKMYIELEQPHTALPILEDALHENDRIAETWYLLCVCHSNTDRVAAQECVERCIEVMRADGEDAQTIQDMLDVREQLKTLNDASEADEEAAAEEAAGGE